MSTPNSNPEKTKGAKRLEAPDIAARKGGQPVVCLTAYTAPMARAVDQVVDIMLVGDSMGMVLYGLATTLPMPLVTMMGHAKAVVDASHRSMCVFDMPFGSYEESKEQAFRNAARVMKKTGIQGVKLEGGEAMAETAHHLVTHGIPVMGHIGLTPQAYHSMGGFKVQGKGEGRDQIIRDAKALDQAGVFSTVIEGVPEPLAKEITAAVKNVTIGIGASAACDGQILVTEDLLGLTPRAPKFVKKYANLNKIIEEALKAYAEDVREGRFPGPEHTYKDK